ncbi:inactive serine/threonine-protein kinase TEX14 isoform X2 [Monodelphis domestica]|uniref:inactive serine/threonine-protein kinase TEX14 isoform X2 n=1 Tax=Monodelphis domestica TaxID=13616 RepID=UPI0024E23D7D|nr:inactive serine/threonine-protein kinase TEX14 isoform X2 [Monodelphis domestica]XP_056670184.1 inactive serine/threonine-protein kinase TEX14 isoform X2 [Monodelphis domestica]XP_056670185.1 inactive serine/threonine-protein kinase TEX14 isoform X2 [Monodelphis domestica]XP_056670186.1 inactive serine/threonine-protein kinase TEX14 isoform X2 [Monodelphis domestica]
MKVLYLYCLQKNPMVTIHWRMSRAVQLPIPCPVQLGSLRNDSLEAQFHEYVKQGNYVKVKKILKKGIYVDTVNSLGQTALFTAALLGLPKLVDVLVDYGSDPNHRCFDGSTPVHAAAFSGNQWILSKLLDAGGDLRLHDEDGKNPQSWALSSGKERSTAMVEFMHRCASHMQAIIQGFSYDLLKRIDSPQRLICSPSRFGSLMHGNPDNSPNRLLKPGVVSSKNIYSFGFGKFYLTGGTQLAYLGSLPVIGEKEVIQADDEPTFSFFSGPYMIMTNLMWNGSRVTVKELNFATHQNCSKLRFADLLIAEQEHSSKLRHPHLLQLMAVCLSQDLEKTRLVYERINIGSLYSILHERRSQFPVLHMEVIVHLLLQINDALRYLHSRGFVHRSLSSYAVHIVSAGEARLTNLEYMIESQDGSVHKDLTRVPIPNVLYSWSAPEVILQKGATVKSDIYSFCIIIQEILTDTLPWNGLEGSVIKESIVLGNHLEADARLPKTYYDIVKTGIQVKQKDRTMNLQDIRYILKNDLKDLIEAQRTHPVENSSVERCKKHPDINIYLGMTSESQREALDLEVRELKETGCQPDSPQHHSALPEKAALDGEVLNRSVTAKEMESHDTASELARACSPSCGDESLCSFEINEIYSCYLDMCDDDLGEITSDISLGDGKNRGERVKSMTGESPERDKGALFDYDDITASEVGMESSSEQWQPLSDTFSSHIEEVSKETKPDVSSKSRTEQYISKCVLNLKISQTLMQQVTESLQNAEQKIVKLEAVRKQQEQHISWPVLRLSARGHDASAMWVAIGPPANRYIPPSLQIPVEQPSCVDRFQNLVKTIRAVREFQSMNLGNAGQRNKRKGSHRWKSFESVPEESIGDQPEKNYQTSSFCGANRQNINIKSQYPQGDDKILESTTRNQDIVRMNAESISSEFCNPKTRNDDSIEARLKWTTEVKEMAEKAASGQLGSLLWYPLNNHTSDSETENDFESMQQSPRESQSTDCHQTDPLRDQDDPGRKDQCEKTIHNDSESEDSEGETRFQNLTGTRHNLPRKKKQPDNGGAFQKNSNSPEGIEKLSSEHSMESLYSVDSSEDVTDEFLTPDHDYFYTPAVQEHLEVKMTVKSQTLSHEADVLEVTQGVCDVQKQDSDNMCSGREKFQVIEKILGNKSECMTELQFTPISFREEETKEPSKELKEEDISLIDIQELSSISWGKGGSCKEIPCKTPKTSHGPTNVSTPLSPIGAASSSISLYKDYSSQPKVQETSCWDSQESIRTMSNTFTTASGKKGWTTNSLSFPSEMPSFGLTTPLQGSLSIFSGPGSSITKAKAESEKFFPTAQQSRLQKVFKEIADSSSPDCIDELPPPSQELLDEIEHLKQQSASSSVLGENRSSSCDLTLNDQRHLEEKIIENKGEDGSILWTKETLYLTEETDRAHSTLDEDLERWLQPSEKSKEFQEGLTESSARETSITDQEVGDKKKKGGERAKAERRKPDSFSGSPEDQEELKPGLWHRLGWSQPSRIIVLDQSNTSD